LVATLRPVLGARLMVVATAFDPDLTTRIDALADPVVELPRGARLSIHPTPALVAIDVDAGAATAARGGKGAAQRALNLTVLPALASEIRLRNLSGAILVDLAGMPARKRDTLGPALAAALAEDPLRPRLLGFTRLGLAEIVRARVHPPLHELLAGPHAAGLMALRAAAVMIADDPARPPVLRTAPPVIAALEADPVALVDLARRAGRALMKRADPSLPATAWVLDPA
jgi:Ribonuclease G/E